MTNNAANLGATFMIAIIAAGCASPEPAAVTVVRTYPPRDAASAITSYFDATRRIPDPNRELVVGKPVHGNCPMGGNTGGYVGWVVPVEYKTRTRDSSVVTITSYFFWFSDETIRGITRRMEVCP